MKNDKKIGVNQILGYILEALLANLSLMTNVDHYAKVLIGQKVFYLLLYGILENDRLSQRSLEDTFYDPLFKLLFNLDQEESVVRSSIAERLTKISPDYFKQIYECIYDQFSSLYSNITQQKYNLIRVDSSMISDTAGKLAEGLDNKSGKKAVKFTTAFDGILPCSSSLFTSGSYSSEDKALPKVVINHVKQETGHKNIYVLDRGLQSTRTMKNFSRDRITFICRAKENRKHIELESLISEDSDLDLGKTILIKDSIVHLLHRYSN